MRIWMSMPMAYKTKYSYSIQKSYVPRLRLPDLEESKVEIDGE